MNVTLREVTKDNFRTVIKLKVAPGQETFVASNLYSLAEARVNESFAPLAICAGETPVGFLMHGLDDHGVRWIIRLMVDEPHQRQGYGRAAMHVILGQLRADPECREVAISYAPENRVAAALYKSLGFVETGEIDDGELVARLRPDGSRPEAAGRPASENREPVLEKSL